MTKKVVTYGLLTSLTIALSLLVVIPIPGTNGFVTLCDAGILTAAMLTGPVGGLVVGALSGAFIDMISGYPQWIFFSLVIHGLQGWLAGYLAARGRKSGYAGLILAGLVMVVGYALASVLLYGPGTGIVSIPSNAAQTLFGAAVAIPLSRAVEKVLPSRYATIGHQGEDKLK